MESLKIENSSEFGRFFGIMYRHCKSLSPMSTVACVCFAIYLYNNRQWNEPKLEEGLLRRTFSLWLNHCHDSMHWLLWVDWFQMFELLVRCPWALFRRQVASMSANQASARDNEWSKRTGARGATVPEHHFSSPSRGKKSLCNFREHWNSNSCKRSYSLPCKIISMSKFDMTCIQGLIRY